jgi:hypothetical protein
MLSSHLPFSCLTATSPFAPIPFLGFSLSLAPTSNRNGARGQIFRTGSRIEMAFWGQILNAYEQGTMLCRDVPVRLGR